MTRWVRGMTIEFVTLWCLLQYWWLFEFAAWSLSSLHWDVSHNTHDSLSSWHVHCGDSYIIGGWWLFEFVACSLSSWHWDDLHLPSWVMAHMWMRHVTHMTASCRIVTWHVWMSLVARVENKMSWFMCERSTSAADHTLDSIYTWLFTQITHSIHTPNITGTLNCTHTQFYTFWILHISAQEWKHRTLVGHPQYRKANLWYLIFESTVDCLGSHY